jgi:hypothetical protein
MSRYSQSRLIDRFLDQNGGIRVYRDNIRIYNCGEPGDDWLGLDLRRVNSPSRSLSRNIVIGLFDINLTDSNGLRENEQGRFCRERALSEIQADRSWCNQRVRNRATSGQAPYQAIDWQCAQR